MLRIKKWWEIEENLVVEALRGYVSERYGKDKPVCRKRIKDSCFFNIGILAIRNGNRYNLEIDVNADSIRQFLNYFADIAETVCL